MQTALAPRQPAPVLACGAYGYDGAEDSTEVAVVAVVVAVYTGGAAVGALSSGAYGSVGAAVAGGAYGTAAAGAAIGAAAGSIVSQGVGVATGVQDSFSWRGVALSAVSAGVTVGVGGALAGGTGVLAGDGWQAGAGRAAISSAITQGIGVATGLQSSFDWRSVAASAVGAGVGQAVAGPIGGALGGSPLGDFAARLATGLVAGAAVAAARGGRVAIQQVAVDAFGNVIGDALARGSVSGGVGSAKASDDPLGDLIARNNGWAGVSATPTFAEDRALRQAANNPMGLPTYSAASNTAPDFSRVNELLANGPRFEADLSTKDAQSLAAALGLASSDQRAPGVQLAMGPAAAFVGVGAGGVAGGAGAAAGGYQSMRPNGVGGPPGYDIRTDLPSSSPGYGGLDPSVGFGAPPSQSESRSWMSNIINGPTPLGFLNNALDSLVFSTNSGGPSIADQAGALGYDRLVKDPPFNSHGQKVFTNGRDFITPDVDQHNGGVWKGFDRRGNRTGTYDANLDRIGK